MWRVRCARIPSPLLIDTEQGRQRDLNSTAPMRGRCFIGTLGASKDRIGSYRLVWTGKQYGKQTRGGNLAAFMPRGAELARRLPHGRTRMTVFPGRRSVELKAATASSRGA